MATKPIYDTLYRFGFGVADGDSDLKNELGGKGANLAGMAKLGLPIPPGCTIPTSQCNSYQKLEGVAAEGFLSTWAHAVLADYEERVVPQMGYMPLMSVRSGARVSMPGMMDTILNVGITTENLDEWKARLGARAALDSYRRLISMYSETVHGFPAEMFAEILDGVKLEAGVKADSDLDEGHLITLVAQYKDLYRDAMDEEFPDTLHAQLAGCIGAVFASWNSERAVEYRNAHGYSHDWGTAVTVQSMVFGNRNDQSATGVLFTRNPSTGESGLFGEFLINAQGEDVVAGIRTPQSLDAMAAWNAGVYNQLAGTAWAMEEHFRDMQDMEFTVEDGKLYILQTRNGKRGAAAAFRIAYDLHKEGAITLDEAIKRVNGKQYLTLKRPAIDPSFKTKPAVVGLPAGPGLVTGTAVFSADEAKKFKGDCILVTHETTPDDFGGMLASVGILTTTGGATSHAAVVARGMDKCCIVGATELKLGTTVKPGDKVTLDGATGRVWVNVEVPITQGMVSKEAQFLLEAAKAKADVTDALRIECPVSEDTSYLPKAGRVVLDVTRFDLSLKRHRDRMRLLITALEERADLCGVIDFCPRAADTSKQDTDTARFLGFKAMPATVTMTSVEFDSMGFARLYCVKKWAKGFQKRWSLRVPNADAIANACAYGWRCVRRVATLGDLLKANGENALIECTDEFAGRLEADGATLADLLGNLTTTLEPMPKAVPEAKLLIAILGK